MAFPMHRAVGLGLPDRVITAGAPALLLVRHQADVAVPALAIRTPRTCALFHCASEAAPHQLGCCPPRRGNSRVCTADIIS